jgi:hypothetical protein
MPNPPKAYRVRSHKSAEVYIVAAASKERARYHFAMLLKTLGKAETFLLALKDIRLCDRASIYDAWAALAMAGTILKEQRVKEILRK